MLNLITISSTWARVIDVMDSEVIVLLIDLLIFNRPTEGQFKGFNMCLPLTPRLIKVLLLHFMVVILGIVNFFHVYSQVQDCLGLLVLVLHLASCVVRYLPLEWLG